MSKVIRASASDALEESILAGLYASVQSILGVTGTIIPIGDLKHEPSTTTLTTVGDEQVVFTGSSAWTAFATPLSKQGIIPVTTFNGVADEADTPDAAFWSNAGPFSVALWFNPATAASNMLLSKWDETTATPLREWQLATNNNGYPSFDIYDESENAQIGRRIETSVATATWQFIVATTNGGTDAADISVYNYQVASQATDDADVVDDAGFANPEDLTTVVALGYHTGAGGTKALFIDGAVAGGPLGPFFCSVELTADQVLRLFELGRRSLGL